MKSIKEWRDHWDKKTNISNSIEINGYCINGIPISKELYYKAIIEPTIRELDLKKDNHFLDVGCGSGMTLIEIEKLVSKSVGTDLSSELLKKYNGISETFVSDANNIPFKNRKFDRILIFGVAVYFPSFKYFKEVTKKHLEILNDDGILLIGDLNIGKKPKNNQYMWYNRDQLLNFLDDLGFAYSLNSQSKLKRGINKRWNIKINKY